MICKHYLAVFLAALALVSVSTNAAAQDTCAAALPSNVQAALNRTYKGWNVLRLEDLGNDDQTIWQRAYGERCPGAVSGRFTPDSEPAIAVLLVRSVSGQREVRLVIVRKPDGRSMMIRTVLTNKVTNYPVIHRQSPGEYRHFYDKKVVVKTSFDVIIFEHLESRAVVLYFTDEGFRQLLISD